MGFDKPIEADQIDDFNIFSAFVRAPLWILGGVLGNKSLNEDDEPATVHRLDDSLPISGVVPDDDLCLGQENKGSINWRDSALAGKGPPGLRCSKNLSWSDESGMSLVEYSDEVSYDKNLFFNLIRPSLVIDEIQRKLCRGLFISF